MGVVTTGTFAQGADAAIDIFFDDCLGWFATPIFISVPIAGTSFPPIAGWLMVAALIFTLDFGLLQLRRIDLAIASVIEKLVPFLALLCVAMSLIVVGMNIGELGAAFNAIFDGAFSASGGRRLSLRGARSSDPAPDRPASAAAP